MGGPDWVEKMGTAPALEIDYEWRVSPVLSLRINNSVKAYSDPNRDGFRPGGRGPRMYERPAERSFVELERLRTIRLLLRDYLFPKYRDHERTTRLLDAVSARHQQFALYLREFPMKRRLTAYGSTTTVSSTGDTGLRVSVARELDGVPLLWICDPLYDPTQDDGAGGADDPSFRLELGEDWEEHARNLIRSAKLIIVDGSVESGGLSAELEMLVEESRKDDAFGVRFAIGHLPEYHRDDFLTAWNLRADRAPGAPFPKATCPWISGSRRAKVIAHIEAHRSFIAKGLERGAEGDVPIDGMLEAFNFLIAWSVALEDIECIETFGAEAARYMSRLADDELPGHDDLAIAYATLTRPRSPALATVIEPNPDTDVTSALLQRYISDTADEDSLPDERIACIDSVDEARKLLAAFELFSKRPELAYDAYLHRMHHLFDTLRNAPMIDRAIMLDSIARLQGCRDSDEGREATAETVMRMRALFGQLYYVKPSGVLSEFEAIALQLRSDVCSLRGEGRQVLLAYIGEILADLNRSDHVWWVALALNDVLATWYDHSALPLLAGYLKKSDSFEFALAELGITSASNISHSGFRALLSAILGFDCREALQAATGPHDPLSPPLPFPVKRRTSVVDALRRPWRR